VISFSFKWFRESKASEGSKEESLKALSGRKQVLSEEKIIMNKLLGIRTSSSRQFLRLILEYLFNVRINKWPNQND